MKKKLYLFFAALVAVMFCTSCENTDVDSDTDEVYTKNFSTEFQSTEMVGDNLCICFAIRNKSGETLKNVRISSVRITDNNGASYSTSMSIDGSTNVGGGDFSKWESNKTKNFVVVASDFNPENVKSVNVEYYFSVPDFEGFSTTVKKTGLKVTDKRAKTGFVTNDNALAYTLKECYATKNNDGVVCYFTYNVENVGSKTLSDVEFSPNRFYFGSNEKWPNEMALNGGSYNSSTSVERTLAKGESLTISYRFEFYNAKLSDFSEISEGSISCRSSKAFIVSEKAKISDVKIEKR